MNLPIDLTAPAVVLLVKWTGLLALAWGAHGLLRRGDPRWALLDPNSRRRNLWYLASR